LAVAAGTGSAALVALEIGTLPFSIDDHGYAAVVTTLLGQVALFAVVATLMAAVVGTWSVRRSVPWQAAAVRIVALWWWFAAGTAIVTWVVLFASPRAV
jgi:hypothetical protein